MSDNPKTNRLPSLSRILIKTPEQYEQLKAGEIGVGYLAVFMEPSIHPGIWNEIPNMVNSPHSQVRFYDENDNEAILLINEKKAIAKLSSSDNMLVKLPSFYQTYDIRYESPDAKTTSADVDAILTWKMAVEISVEDYSDVAVDLMARFEKVRSLDSLKQLTLVVQRHSYKQLFVGTFLSHVSQLEKVEFLAGEGLTSEELQAFVDQQEIPTAYEIHVKSDRVIYKKTL